MFLNLKKNIYNNRSVFVKTAVVNIPTVAQERRLLSTPTFLPVRTRQALTHLYRRLRVAHVKLTHRYRCRLSPPPIS
uniref:Uncharacterized protein n=1 Tax=Anguilla anguilla TaxID=7936 RepID=A0A0E9XRI0_ANGAN